MSIRSPHILIVLLAFLVATGPATAQKRNHDGPRGGPAAGRGDGPRDERYGFRQEDVVELGSNKVDFGRDRDVIRVGEAEGAFKSIFLAVRDGDVFVNEMEVVYGNGSRNRFSINQLIRGGDRSQPFDLQGERRLVKEVTLSYRARPGERKRPTVTVYASRPVLRLGDKIGNFEVIGVARVDGGDDSTRVRLDRDEGRVGQIKLRSVDGRVYVRGMDITFGNGVTQRVTFDQRLGEGEETSTVDLAGFNRQIRDITIYTRDRRRGSGARLVVLGHEAPVLTDIPHNWVRFGSASVGLGVDRDVIRVGKAEGRFKAIALRVTKNDILLREIKVIYENGQADVQPMWYHLPANSRTTAIPLKGDRFIREIQLVYQSRPDRRGQQAVVDMFGEYTDSWMRDNAADFNIPRDWVSFGSQSVDFGRDTDVIRVGKQDVTFQKIAFVARHNDVYISDITIVYGNGEVDKRNIHRFVVANSRTPTIELSGNRNIAQIKINYQSRFDWRGRRAAVEVFGDPSSQAGRGSPGWDLLGAQRVSMVAKDVDSFRVGEKAGRFKSLRVTVRGGNVRFYGMRIVYGNGSIEDVQLSGELRDGQSSQPLDLKGRERFIDRIDFKYRAKLGLKRPPEVEVWGRR